MKATAFSGYLYLALSGTALALIGYGIPSRVSDPRNLRPQSNSAQSINPTAPLLAVTSSPVRI